MGIKQVISSFSEMDIDMDYPLCVPSIHAVCHDEEAVIDFSGQVRLKSKGFPEHKIPILQQWIVLHREEICENHKKRGHNEFPLDPIEPI